MLLQHITRCSIFSKFSRVWASIGVARFYSNHICTLASNLLFWLSNTVSPSTAANEYYVGFFKNYRRPGNMTLFITTAKNVTVPFTVSSSIGQIYFGNATNIEAKSVTLPSSFALEDNTVRDKGVWIHAADAITVHGMNDASNSADGFVALPCYDFQKQNYIFYAVSTHYNQTADNSSEVQLMSQVLLVGCENDTELTITPTQTIEIPSDLVRGRNSPISVPSGGSHTIILNRLQTFMFHSTLDLTGSKVVSSKPIAFFSGHECADVPVGVAACDHLVEQLPPTLAWGRKFFLASSKGKSAGEQYKLITSFPTTMVVCYCYSSGGIVSETISTTLNGTGSSYKFHIAQNMFCNVQASSPVLLVQFAIGASREPSEYGDPFMMMIPPVEQYRNNYTFVAQSGFQNAITVTVTSGFFNPGNIVLNDTSLGSAEWNPIYCSTETDSVCGYGTRVSISTGRNFIYHRDPNAKLGTFVYGFSHQVSYGYPAGVQLVPTRGTIVVALTFNSFSAGSCITVTN